MPSGPCHTTGLRVQPGWTQTQLKKSTSPTNSICLPHNPCTRSVPGQKRCGSACASTAVVEGMKKEISIGSAFIKSFLSPPSQQPPSTLCPEAAARLANSKSHPHDPCPCTIQTQKCGSPCTLPSRYPMQVNQSKFQTFSL